jgi:hypothetical protein
MAPAACCASASSYEAALVALIHAATVRPCTIEGAGATERHTLPIWRAAAPAPRASSDELVLIKVPSEVLIEIRVVIDGSYARS